MSDTEFPTHGEDDVALPKATIAKFISDTLPGDMACAREARDLISDCAKEFITLVSSEANEICEKESKKTISPEHIEVALKHLGFEDYLEELQEVLKSHKQDAKVERQKRQSKLDKSGLSHEELLRQQESLFAASRARYEAGESAPADE